MKLNDAEAFEKFLHTKYVGHKRFSLEGAETAIPMLDYLFNEATADGVQEAVIGMAHRGRLNVLANIARQVVREDLPRVRRRRRSEHHAGLRRREVPPRRRRHAPDAGRLAHEADAGVESEPPRSGRSDRRRDGPREAEAASATTNAPGSCRCSFTATPRSPDRASSRRR